MDEHKIIDLSEQRRLRARKHLIATIRNVVHSQALGLMLLAAFALASFASGILLGLHWRAAASITLVASAVAFLFIYPWLSHRQRNSQ